jgi:hypothetical protein
MQNCTARGYDIKDTAFVLPRQRPEFATRTHSQRCASLPPDGFA